MWTKVRRVSGRVELRTASDTGTLFVVEAEAELVLPPLSLSQGVQYFVLPLGPARVKMTGADEETLIDTGNGPRRAESFGGQQIITLIPLDSWRAVGHPTPEDLSQVVPKVEPEPEQEQQPKPEPKTKARK